MPKKLQEPPSPLEDCPHPTDASPPTVIFSISASFPFQLPYHHPISHPSASSVCPATRKHCSINSFDNCPGPRLLLLDVLRSVMSFHHL